MDGQTVIKIFKHQAGKYAPAHLISTAVGFLVGFGAVSAVMIFIKPDTYANIGTFIAGCIFVMCGIIMCVVSFATDFANAVKMGIGRRNYIAGTLLYYTAASVCGMGLVLISRLETVLMDLLYSGSASHEPVFEKLFERPLPVFGVCALMIVIGMVTGAAMAKWGAKGLVTVYFILIIGINILPRSINKISDALRSVAIFNMLMGADTAVKVLLAAIVIFIAVGLSIKAMLKYDVAA